MSDVVVTIEDTLLDEDQGAHSSIPEAASQAPTVVPTSLASQASEYLRRRLLAPVTGSPSIQSPMREHPHLEANWSNSEIVEIPASPEVEDQSAVAVEKVDGGTQVSDPLPIEEDMDIHSRLTLIAE